MNVIEEKFVSSIPDSMLDFFILINTMVRMFTSKSCCWALARMFSAGTRFLGKELRPLGGVLAKTCRR